MSPRSSRSRTLGLYTFALLAGGTAVALGACNMAGGGRPLGGVYGDEDGGGSSRKAKKGSSDSEDESEDGTDDGSDTGNGNGGPDITAGSGTTGGDMNKGPAVNVAGYDNVRTLVAERCAECHHAGTYLDLEKGADAETAARVVATLEGGTMPPAPRERLSEADIARFRAWRDGKSVEQATSTIPPVSNAPVAQILPAATLARYKSGLPKVGFARLQALLESPATLYYDKSVMPGAYQDTVGNGADVPFGARLNSSGAGLIVPEGRKLFDTAGETWAFPFGHTAGADYSSNAVIVNFITLPTVGGKLQPIAYKIENGTKSGFPITRWDWSFPKGTVFGEVVMINDGGALLTSEIRVRERYTDKWATNVFRPFPTAKALAEAVKAQRPSWQNTPDLTAFVGALESTGALAVKRITSPAFNNIVTFEGAADAPLPPVSDAALIRDLLTKTPFVSAYGTTWKTNGTAKAFGFTGPASGLSVVPVKFDTGALEVRESTCIKCHDQGGTFIGGLVDRAVLYGDIWGVDRIFSFYPFDPSRIEASGNENRTVRPAFASAGIVERYEAGKHPASSYTFYTPAGR